MGKLGKGPEASTTPPPTITTPAQFTGSDYSFTLQAAFENQKALGQLQQSTFTLTNEVQTLREKVGRMEKVLYAATVIVAIGVAVLTWIANKGVDLIIATTKAAK